MLQLAISKGAEVNRQNKGGQTGLHMVRVYTMAQRDSQRLQCSRLTEWLLHASGTDARFGVLNGDAACRRILMTCTRSSKCSRQRALTRTLRTKRDIQQSSASEARRTRRARYVPDPQPTRPTHTSNSHVQLTRPRSRPRAASLLTRSNATLTLFALVTAAGVQAAEPEGGDHDARVHRSAGGTDCRA
eukprot:4881202-Pyramimonas_sp.AAC.1